ncbi:lipoprotein insertase outer membrane protein LolB [Luteimonas saliphila]|uniref:lipoprotein insertase outer membrane protein LolB n=1 Tax=Luteimonas saliphila TaxID=2804919 RepID=UPI00192D77C1
MRRLRACALAAVAAAMLAACVSSPTRAPVPIDRAQAARADAQRAALGDWSLQGRVAISSGRQGGSGRLDWTQRGGRYDIALAAPVTRQGWRLSGDAVSARLEGIEGGPREGGAVEALLFQATGWDIPVRAMVDWIRGVPAEAGAHGPARLEHGSGDLPVRLEQGGWRIEYRDWYEAGVGQPALPRRIDASRGEARVRLVVDGWTVVPGQAVSPTDDAASPDVQLERTLQGLRLDDPAADMAARVAVGDLRPVGVCGFACLAPGYGPDGAAGVHGIDMRIIDGTGDVVLGERHLQLKHRAEAYARAYNAALAAWRAAHPGVADALPAD